MAYAHFGNDEQHQRLIDALARDDLHLALMIDVEDGGEFFYTVDGNVEVLAELDPVDVIMRGYARDLEALVNGRMRIGDAVTTERVRFSGDLAKIARLSSNLQALYLDREGPLQ